MRNDNNTTVIVKTERSSGAAFSNKSSRESLKENSIPKKSEQSVVDDRRSASVEIIANKPVEIDITNDDSDRSMPPPLPPKQKRGRPKKNNETDQGPLPRFTRSKIKKEKPSMEKAQSSKQLTSESSQSNMPLRKSNSDSSVLLKQNKTAASSSMKGNDETVAASEKTIHKKGEKKKYPIPMLIKMEKLSDTKATEEKEEEKLEAADKTFDFPINEAVSSGAPNIINNETITLAPANVNETITLEKNPHDSLMTEDNDEDEDDGEASMYVPLSKYKTNPLPQLNLKKNEVFK